MRSLIAAVCLASLLTAQVWAGDADEVKLTKDAVPAVVLATMQKAAAGAELGEFEKETKKGKEVFTATFKDKAGKEQEVTVSPEGALISVEAENDADEKK